MNPAFIVSAALILVPLAAQAQEKPPCAVGLKVTVLSCINYPGHLIAYDGKTGRWQVRCDDGGDKDWIDASALKWNCVAGGPPPITAQYFVGRWSLFIGPTPHYENRGANDYLVVGSGAKAGFITINANGTYSWPDGSKLYAGKWRAMAPGELKYMTIGPAILLTNGPSDMNWEMWRGHMSDDKNRDHVTIEGMKLGLSYDATRQ